MASSKGLPIRRTSSYNGGRGNCAKWAPSLMLLVIILQVAFWIHFDVLNTSRFQLSIMSMPKFTFYSSTIVDSLSGVLQNIGSKDETGDRTEMASNTCEKWLEENDKITYSRDFSKRPILIGHGENKAWTTCAIGCVFRNPTHSETADAVFGLNTGLKTASVLRSMESSSYYHENDLVSARRRGYAVVMTTNLASDVPVGYFSWAEYDLMAPLKEKTEKAHAAAFISNCGGHSFRLDAIVQLQKLGVTIDSYGSCLRSRHEQVVKLTALQHYKFSLAFENSIEDDYVTEKFWQSLVAGSVPVVVGAPNIQYFAPAGNAFIHIKSLNDVGRAAAQIKYLVSNDTAYNETLKWKFEGPSDAFKALVDMAVVHSSCRLCIHLGTKIRLEDEMRNTSQSRPCQCKQGSDVVYHLYVRERGKFEMESIFLRSSNMTIQGIHNAIITKFESMNYIPIWNRERPKVISGEGKLKIYKVYPVGMTQRQALYTWNFYHDQDVKTFVEVNPCAKLEVIFV
eukprot:c24815_g1_i1 orf=455-1984(+)